MSTCPDCGVRATFADGSQVGWFHHTPSCAQHIKKLLPPMSEASRRAAELELEVKQHLYGYFNISTGEAARMAHKLMPLIDTAISRAVADERLAAEKFYDQMARDYVKAALAGVEKETARAVEGERTRATTILDAFRGCPDHVYQHEGCVMCKGRGQTIDRMEAALRAPAKHQRIFGECECDACAPGEKA